VLQSQGGKECPADNKKNCYKVKDERNVLHIIKTTKNNWIDYNLRRNCPLRHVIEARIEVRIEVIGRRGRRRKQLLGDLKEERGYCGLKVETPARTEWRTGYQCVYGTLVGLTTE
jgi:hypothetical protein